MSYNSDSVIVPHTDFDVLTVLGTVLSHGYLVTGVLPVRIVLPTLMAICLGSKVSLSDELLINSFLDDVSETEEEVLR